MIQALTILSSILLILLILMGLFAYDTFVNGMPKTEALQKKGSSRLLSQWVMEFAYWILTPLVKGLVWCRIHPNTISWASVFFSGFGAVALTKGYFGYGASLSVIAFVLDAVDGMVARMANMTSRAGAVLDSTLDRYTEFLFFMGLIYYYRFDAIALGMVAAALCGSWMVSYSSAKAEAIQVKVPRGTMRRPERLVLLILGTALAPILTPLIEGDVATPFHFSVLVSVGLVAVLSNATAINRMYCLYRGLAENASTQATSLLSPRTRLQKLRQATLTSSLPTAVDVVTVAFLVEVVGLDFVSATAAGVTLGTTVGYLIRRFLLLLRRTEAPDRDFSQELVIAVTNVLWNVWLVYGFTEWLGIHYLVSRVLSIVAVGVVWNWPLNFRYMFPSESTANFELKIRHDETAEQKL